MRIATVLLASVLVFAGCTTETQKAKPSTAGYTPESTRVTDPTLHIPTGPDNRGVNADALTDPCAARLHDLAGAMLMYYVLHHEMPAKLEALSALGEADQKLEFTCPKSGQPYGYVPNGLGAPGKGMRIVVFDPTPVHNGYRWCMMVSPSKPGSIAVDVVPMGDAVFNGYQANE